MVLVFRFLLIAYRVVQYTHDAAKKSILQMTAALFASDADQQKLSVLMSVASHTAAKSRL